MDGPSLEWPGWTGGWATCSRRRCPCHGTVISLSGVVTAAYPKHGHSNGKQGLHYQPMGSKKASWLLNTISWCCSALTPTHLSLCEQRKVRKQQHDPCKSGNEGPLLPSKLLFLPKGSGLEDSSTQDKLHFWGLQSQACLGELVAQSTCMPSQTPQQPQPSRS